jgi:hypothetical protein
MTPARVYGYRIVAVSFVTRIARGGGYALCDVLLSSKGSAIAAARLLIGYAGDAIGCRSTFQMCLAVLFRTSLARQQLRCGRW